MALGSNLKGEKQNPASKTENLSIPLAQEEEQYVSSFLVEATEEEDKGERHQIVVFGIEDEEFAVDISLVKEVVEMPPITPIPQSPDYVLGVANVRGNVHAILDLGVRLGLHEPQSEQANQPYALVLDHEEIKVALNIYQVPAARQVFESEIERSSAAMTRSQQEQPYIEGIINQENRLITLVNLIELTKVSEMEENEGNL
ncbi:MAG: chemotaxis protein CheW [Cytophagales bacterium]|nr:chemotaxis protein CheW [Cytophagales bacterium]